MGRRPAVPGSSSRRLAGACDREGAWVWLAMHAAGCCKAGRCRMYAADTAPSRLPSTPLRWHGINDCRQLPTPCPQVPVLVARYGGTAQLASRVEAAVRAQQNSEAAVAQGQVAAAILERVVVHVSTGCTALGRALGWVHEAAASSDERLPTCFRRAASLPCRSNRCSAAHHPSAGRQRGRGD